MARRYTGKPRSALEAWLRANDLTTGDAARGADVDRTVVYRAAAGGTPNAKHWRAICRWAEAVADERHLLPADRLQWDPLGIAA